MQSLGIPIHFSKQDDIVIRHGSALEMNFAVHLFKKDVFKKNGKRIGKVKEIFGPVKNPYISVKPIKGAIITEKEELFING